MKTHRYFERRKHDHKISIEEVEEALRNEVKREVQPNGRICLWGYHAGRDKYIRVILTPDGERIFNAFPDSNFTRKWRRK